MRILITGSSGMLGKDIAALFSKRNSKDEVYGISRTGQLPGVKNIQVDLTNNQVLQEQLQLIKPELIIHCAASVNVDACEENRAQAHALHVESTRQLAAFSEHTRLIYISTDSVFDGEKGDYSEDSVVNPLNYYAESKWEGEQAALTNSKSLVLRTNIYGFHNPSTTGSLVEWALHQLTDGKAINGFHDVFFNPLYTVQLAALVEELADKSVTGILNAGSDRFISKCDFLLALAETFGFDQSLVKAASVNDINFKAKRPKNTTLNTTLLTKVLGHEAPAFSSGMQQLKRDFQTFIEA
jgi:dTDP-4-dehydrorhamnose reductase